MSLANNKKSLIIAFILACIILAVLIFLYAKTSKAVSNVPVEDFNYVVAKVDIQKGEELTEENIETKDVKMKIANGYKTKKEILKRKSNCVIPQGRPVVSFFLEDENILKGAKVKEPEKDFTSFPIYMKKDILPPYVISGSRFDLKTKNNTVAIDNVRILDIIEPESSSGNRMLLLEINIQDVQDFIDSLKESGNVYLLQKNIQNNGVYKYHKQGGQTAKAENSTEVKGKIPKVPDNDDEVNTKLLNIPQETKVERPQFETVEVIVGNEKRIMGFKN